MLINSKPFLIKLSDNKVHLIKLLHKNDLWIDQPYILKLGNYTVFNALTMMATGWKKDICAICEYTHIFYVLIG